MGLAPDAELIWGYPVARYDKDYEITPLFEALWSDEYDYWRSDLPGQLEVHSWGHYDDPDGPRAILTGKEIKKFRADAWTPKRVETTMFNLVVTDKTIEELNALAKQADVPVNFYNGHWWLVASYG